MATNQPVSVIDAADIRDIVPPVEIVSPWSWLWWGLGFLALAIAVFVIWKWWQKKKSQIWFRA